ncbi:MAG: hypothetical protein QM537_04675 [Candidatus Symbiobacter sp.]|nr:hypothetical protein [Candidatus Symbiobacter sp.]
MLMLEVPNHLETRLKAACDYLATDASSFLHEALLEHLEDIEDIHEAEMELLAIEQGQSQVYTLAEIKAKHGLES